MSVIKSLILATEMAVRKRDHADAAVLQALAVRQLAMGQLDQLESYAADTASRWMASAQVSSTPELMKHHYQFVDRLDRAIGLQRLALDTSTHQVELAKKARVEAEVRLAALRLVLKKKQAGIAALQARNEQKQTDEFAALQYSWSVADRLEEGL